MVEMVAEEKVDVARERGWNEVAEGVVAEVAEGKVVAGAEVVPREGGGYEEAEENLVEVAKAVKVVELELVVEEDERKERTGCRGRGRVSSKEGQDRTIVRGRRKKKMKLMQTRNARK